MLLHQQDLAQVQDPVQPVSPVVAPSGDTLTLASAEEAALRNQPRIAAAELRARAAQQRVAESRSALLPTVGFNATGSRVADTGTSTASGALTTSSVSDRFAYGGSLQQLVTDFGRTSALVASARDRVVSQRDLVTLTHAQVRLAVRQAYFGVLGAEAVLHAAEEAQANRHLITHQITALANSQLRSTLDVNFAAVLESEAELTVVHARSIVEQQRSRLAVAMGETQSIAAKLEDLPLPPLTAQDEAALLAEALQTRADLDAAKFDAKAAVDFTKAEHRLNFPTLEALGAAGQVPFHDRTLQGDYAAAGFNLNVPIFNGGLFRAREAEASLEASARNRDVADLTLRVNQQVRDAISQMNEALRALDVTQRLVAQSAEALRLAQARYDAGLGGIVELNEAQLNETSARINAADARYSYLARRADLDYAIGLLN
ncbi:TolC family protein [Granulicella sp. WH15]|nr:TolC family protein [Granulicella sp. WH15]